MTHLLPPGQNDAQIHTALAVDIAGACTKLAPVHSQDAVASSTRIPTGLDRGPEAYVDPVLETCRPLVSAALSSGRAPRSIKLPSNRAPLIGAVCPFLAPSATGAS